MNPDMVKKFPAKLLLFGEYSIILGSEALAVPLPAFSGNWAQTAERENLAVLQQSLPEFCVYLADLNAENAPFCKFNVEKLKTDLQNGVYFASNVPQGYGVGSSGVLCAGVYDRYAREKTADASVLKVVFAKMEHFFHGASSGTDPLVCYLNKSIHIVDGKVETIVLPQNRASEHAFLLLDTCIARNTDPLVNLFLQKSKKEAFRQKCEAVLNPAVAKAIKALVGNDVAELKTNLQTISDFQEAHFSEMIPEKFKFLWEIGKENAFVPKICGAGGGGYMLLYSWNVEKTLSALSGNVVETAFRF